MIVVKVELWPLGDESKKQTLGIARISNDATGTKASGNYNYFLYGKNGYPMKNHYHGKVLGYPRKRLHPWYLVKRVLEEAFRS